MPLVPRCHHPSRLHPLRLPSMLLPGLSMLPTLEFQSYFPYPSLEDSKGPLVSHSSPVSLSRSEPKIGLPCLFSHYCSALGSKIIKLKSKKLSFSFSFSFFQNLKPIQSDCKNNPVPIFKNTDLLTHFISLTSLYTALLFRVVWNLEGFKTFCLMLSLTFSL